jgi:hypothetical protein
MLIEYLSKNRFILLLAITLCHFLIVPFFEGTLAVQIISDSVLSIVCLSAIYAIRRNKLLVLVAAILTVPFFISIWSNYAFGSETLIRAVNFLGILVLALVAVSVLIHIFRERRVTIDLICASIVVYLIIGLMWGFAYGLLDSLQPESFSIPEGKLEDSRLLFLYYSFVSLTTLGYGDVTPMTAPASFLSLIEAVVGQMYVAILVARLVGVNISQSLQDDPGKQRGDHEANG